MMLVLAKNEVHLVMMQDFDAIGFLPTNSKCYLKQGDLGNALFCET